MTVPSAPQYAPFQPQPPMPEPKRTNWKAPLALLAAAVVGGLVSFSATSAYQTPKAPESCIKALDLNEEALGYISDSMSSITDRDWTAASRSTAKAKALIPDLNAAKSACRAAK